MAPRNSNTQPLRRRRRRVLQPPAGELGTNPSEFDCQAYRLEKAVIWRDVDTLTPYERNARMHSEKQIAQLAASIEQFGFVNPILVDADGKIIAGHGRVLAAKRLGLEKAPTLCIEHLSEDQKRAYIIADNRLAELAGWDEQILALELQHLEVTVDFDVEITGFETAEIDTLIGGLDQGAEGDADDIDDLSDSKQVVSRPGDLWMLGHHLLLCGDARDPKCYARLMDDTKAQMIFADPPYNTRIDGNVCGSGRIRHDEFVMASGEMSEVEYISFLKSTCANLASHSADGAIHFVCMDWRHAYELMTAGREIYSKLINVCVWNKDNGGMGSFYRSKHELVFVYKHGEAQPINNFGLGEHGRYRTNVWDYAGVNSLRRGRLDDLRMHPTVKPVALVADAIKDCSKRNGIVLDAFAGSGTTIIAAENTGRIARALELDPKYVDVAVRRWGQQTGETAIHAETKLTLQELAEARGVAVVGNDGLADQGQGPANGEMRDDR